MFYAAQAKRAIDYRHLASMWRSRLDKDPGDSYARYMTGVNHNRYRVAQSHLSSGDVSR
jgi:hypothetical protein